jgi:hypothetical protein
MRRFTMGLVFLVAATLAGAEEFFIPMVGQKQGQDGSWWNTEVWIANTTAATGGYAVVFLPAGQPNLDGLRAEPAMEDIGPGSTAWRNDLVPEGKVGVLRILTTPGVVVFGRVYNAAGRNSFGQAMPAMTRSAATRPGEIASILGLRRTPQFRTNIALFNPSADNGVARIRLLSQRGEELGEESYRLAAGGYVQIDDALHALGQVRGEHLRVEVSGTVPLFAFGSVIDTRSNAPTLIPQMR